uniref:Uncharacterized protein n=1 Tax=Tetraselmis sp. GSL018 TaxID=582737 RepID=A0A061S3F5_9CHLO
MAELIAMAATRAILGWLKNRYIDWATLNRFKAEYDSLPDKRRRPGPKLRKAIRALESGSAEDARDTIKELSDELLDIGGGWLRIGEALAEALSCL